ncbi:MAG: 50S ribosomal protein L30 [Bdellovibrionales bacterium]|nr:50S ribosomal protein L30 [Bdellovibrionales bacterium]
MSGKNTEKVRVRQIRGIPGRPQRTRLTLQALGLGRVGKERELPLNGPVAGLIKKVRHLVSVEKV